MFQSDKTYDAYHLLRELAHLTRCAIAHHESHPIFGGGIGPVLSWTPMQADLDDCIRESWGRLSDLWEEHASSDMGPWPPAWAYVYDFSLRSPDPISARNRILNDLNALTRSVLGVGRVDSNSTERWPQVEELRPPSHRRVYEALEAAPSRHQAPAIVDLVNAESTPGKKLTLSTVQKALAALTRLGVLDNAPRDGYRVRVRLKRSSPPS